MLDSQGRTPPERLTLAGYPFSSGWESYAFAADTPSEAYEPLLADDDSCPELGSSAYSSVGVGSAGDVFVVTHWPESDPSSNEAAYGAAQPWPRCNANVRAFYEIDQPMPNLRPYSSRSGHTAGWW